MICLREHGFSGLLQNVQSGIENHFLCNVCIPDTAFRGLRIFGRTVVDGSGMFEAVLHGAEIAALAADIDNRILYRLHGMARCGVAVYRETVNLEQSI